jgi:hypothetical protein
MIRPPGLSDIIWNQFMRKFSQKFKTGASVAAVVVVLFGIYGYRKLQALAADPTGEKDCGPPVGGGEQARLIWSGSRRLHR